MTTTWKHHKYRRRDPRWLWLTHRDYNETTTLADGKPFLTQTFEKGAGERLGSWLKDFEWEHDISLAAWMSYAALAISVLALVIAVVNA